jgi:hypothetical protein
MPRVARIPGDDAPPPWDNNFGVILGRLTAFPNHAPDGGRAQEEAGSSQDLSHALASHRREQALQLPNEIPDEIRVTVHGLDRLDQASFAVLVEPPHPDLQRVKVD